MNDMNGMDPNQPRVRDKKISIKSFNPQNRYIICIAQSVFAWKICENFQLMSSEVSLKKLCQVKIVLNIV